MAYDEVLAQRIHDVVDGEEGWTSKKMFGGLGFMLDGHMAVAAGSSGSLMVRVDPAQGEQLLDGDAVRPMEMRGRARAVGRARRDLRPDASAEVTQPR